MTLKTVLNAIRTMVGGVSAQLDRLTGRVTEVEEIVLPAEGAISTLTRAEWQAVSEQGQTLVYSGDIAINKKAYNVGPAPLFQLTSGTEYVVVYNGDTYTCTAKEVPLNNTSLLYLGNSFLATVGEGQLSYYLAPVITPEDTGEPFLYLTTNETDDSPSADITTEFHAEASAASTTVQVEAYSVDMRPVALPEKFLPDSVGGADIGLGLTGATVGQALRIAEVDDNGVPLSYTVEDFPTDDHINDLIDEALGVIENGTY